MKSKFPSFFARFLAWCFALVGNGRAAESPGNLVDPAQVIQAYLRTTYARDVVEAYRLISGEDKKVRDVNRYVQQRGPFSGFILEAAKKLSESVEIEPLQQKTAAAKNRRRPRSVTGSISRSRHEKNCAHSIGLGSFSFELLERRRARSVLSALARKQRDGALDMTEGEESFERVKEETSGAFFELASGVRIPLQLDLSQAGDLQVALSKREVVLQSGEIFEIRGTISNQTKVAITTRIGHLAAPRDNADYLDFVQCGFLLPVTISPEKEQEYSGTYMYAPRKPAGRRAPVKFNL